MQEVDLTTCNGECPYCHATSKLLIATCCGYAVCIQCVEKYKLSENECSVCKNALTKDSWLNPKKASKVHDTVATIL